MRTYQTCFRPLGEEHHAQVKKFYREVVALGFKIGLLYEGMIVQPSGTAVGGIDEIVNMDFDKVGLSVAGVRQLSMPRCAARACGSGLKQTSPT